MPGNGDERETRLREGETAVSRITLRRFARPQFMVSRDYRRPSTTVGSHNVASRDYRNQLRAPTDTRRHNDSADKLGFRQFGGFVEAFSRVA